MRKVFLLLALLPLLCFGQGTPKKFSQIPARTTPTVDASDYFVGTRDNHDGTFTDYRYKPSASIVDTILGVTYFALDSMGLTKMNALTIVNVVHGSPNYAYFLSANQFARVKMTTSLIVDTMIMPNRPLDKTLIGVDYISSTGATVCVMMSQGGQKFTTGQSYDTIRIFGERKIYQYTALDSTWTLVWSHTPTSGINANVNPPNLVQAASTASLTGTYSNGANGIGATFTSTAQVHIVVDNYSMNAGDRLLLTGQPSTFQNGVYVVTQTGTASVAPFILTRASNYNAPWNINNTGLIPVLHGALNTATQWVISSTVNTVGVDSINFQLAGRNIDQLLSTDSITQHNIIGVTPLRSVTNTQTGFAYLIGFSSDGSGRFRFQEPNDSPAYNIIAGHTNGWSTQLHITANQFNSTNSLNKQVGIQFYDDTTGLLWIDWQGKRFNDFLRIDSAMIMESQFSGATHTQTWTLLTAPRAAKWLDNSGSISMQNHTIFTPVTTNTITLLNNQYNTINPAGTIAALTITLPASPANNDRVYIKFEQTVTTITWAGGALANSPATGTAGTVMVLEYDLATTTWY